MRRSSKFLPAQPEPPLQAAGAAEEIGLALETRGRTEEALAFLERAREQELLGPEGRRALARLLAGQGRGLEARALLAGDPEPAGPVERLFALLLDARIAAGLGQPEVAWRLKDSLLLGEPPIPAAAAGPVLGYLERLAPGELPGKDAFLAGAILFRELEEGRMTAPGASARTVEGNLVLPLGPGRLMAIPAKTVERLCEAALEAAGRPGLSLGLGPAPEGALAAGRLEPTGVGLYALPAGIPASRRVLGAARLLLGLAALALVAGVVLGVRHLRRELALSRLRLEFVDLVSHELRTPLTGLSLRAELLARGEVPVGKESAYLKALQGEVGRLSDLVNRILDFARLERDRMPLERRELPARAVLAAGLRAGRGALRSAGQKLKIEIPRDLPLLAADPEVFARVLRNLLENAARYAPPGSEVTLAARQAGGFLEIDLADRGPGVPAGERSAVFAPFYRGRNRTASGSGLGLAIVAQAVRAHGGAVSVADRPGGGALFSVRLPLAQGGAHAPAADRRG